MKKTAAIAPLLSRRELARAAKGAIAGSIGISVWPAASNGGERYDRLEALFQADAGVSPSRVPFNRTADGVVDCRFFPGRKMRQIKVTFTSQVFRGRPCVNEGVLFLPVGKPAEAVRGAAAIILGGEVLSAKDAELDWVERIVIDLGVACFVVLKSFDMKAYGVRNLGQLMDMGNQAFFKTGDPREVGYYALARIFSAAATVIGACPEVKATRFVATGSSKGGMAALIACAGDPRIVGAYATAWNAGNLAELTRLKGERWGWHNKPKDTGPAGMTAADAFKMLDSDRGREYRRLFDPCLWQDLPASKFIMPAVGTNDPLSHLLADRSYFDGFKCKKAMLRVPNYPHGRTSAGHAQGWRFAVAAALAGRPIPAVRIETRRAGDAFEIFASLSNVGRVKRLVIHTATDPSGDYRRAKWQSSPVAAPADLSRPFRAGSVEAPATGTKAAFLELVDQHALCDSIVSSNVIEIGRPVEHKLETSNSGA